MSMSSDWMEALGQAIRDATGIRTEEWFDWRTHERHIRVKRGEEMVWHKRYSQELVTRIPVWMLRDEKEAALASAFEPILNRLATEDYYAR